jgi:hypothetical protein
MSTIYRYVNKNAKHNFRVRKLVPTYGRMWLCEVVDKNPRFDVGTTVHVEESFLKKDQ